MKKILSLFALLVAIVTGAQGSEVTDLKTLSADHNVYFEDIVTAKVNAGTLFDSDYLLALAGGCSYATNKGTDGTIKKKYCLRVKGTSQDVIAFKVGDACTVTIYADRMDDREPVINTSISTASAIKGTKTLTSGKNGYATYDIPAAGTYYIIGSNGDCYLAGLEFDFADATTAPTFTTNLSATADVTVGVAEVFTVDTDNATSYQWYKDNAEIEGATDKTYSYTATAAGTVNIKCVASNKIGSTTSTVCAVTATAPTSAPTITTDLEAAYDVIKGKTLELSIVAEDAASYQWYKDDVAIEGATSTSYTFSASSTIGATNEIYCSAINAAGSTKSTVATITTVGRADCELTNIKFSNGAYGAISNTGADDIQVPYMAGTEAPTVEEASINISDGATYVLSGNTLTVTAENGTTSKEYTINAVEITPLAVSADVAKTEFTAVPSWVFNLYGFGENNGDKDYKGVKFAKKVDEAGNMRIAKGNTRQYWFIGAAKSITLTSGTAAERNIKVYRNGVQLSEPTKTAAKGSDITIALDETAPCMIMIESNQTGGDGGFTFYAIEAAASPIEVTLGTNGYSTYCGDENFTVTSGATAYTATLSGTTVTLNKIAANTVIGKGTGIVLVGTEGETAVLTPTTEAAASMELGNALVGVNAETTDVNADAYVLASNGTKTAFVKAGSYANKTALLNKAYIVYAGMQEGSLDIQFEGEATAINNVNANDNADSAAPVKVIKNGKLFIGNYNVAGQLVK